MISKEVFSPSGVRIHQIPETIDEAETLLNEPWTFDSPRGQKAIVMSWLLQRVGDSEKAFRLYMAHQAYLEGRARIRRTQCVKP